MDVKYDINKKVLEGVQDGPYFGLRLKKAKFTVVKANRELNSNVGANLCTRIGVRFWKFSFLAVSQAKFMDDTL